MKECGENELKRRIDRLVWGASPLPARLVGEYEERERGGGDRERDRESVNGASLSGGEKVVEGGGKG